MAEIDAQLAAADARSHWQQALASRLAAAVPDAVSRIEELVVARTGTHAREEDLRGGVADELRARGELVLT
jgi:hypothetical protein